MVVLKVANVSKRLGDFTINSINLEVDRGQYFIILGPSGTGKTVLLEIIAGFHHPDKGRVYLYDKDITRLPAEARKMGFVYQDYMLFPHMTVKDNILFGAKKCFPASSTDKSIPSIHHYQFRIVM
jgi:ABC-type Fe3+/spermidine/putrescine transport system ATPase subunit